MACKEFGSYNSTLTASTKLKKTEKAATLPRSIREVRSQGKPPLTKLERPTDRHRTAEPHQQKPPWEPVPR